MSQIPYQASTNSNSPILAACQQPLAFISILIPVHEQDCELLTPLTQYKGWNFSQKFCKLGPVPSPRFWGLSNPSCSLASLVRKTIIYLRTYIATKASTQSFWLFCRNLIPEDEMRLLWENLRCESIRKATYEVNNVESNTLGIQVATIIFIDIGVMVPC